MQNNKIFLRFIIFALLCMIIVSTTSIMYMFPEIAKMPHENEPFDNINKDGKSYELFIARYNEDLSWLNKSNYVNQFDKIHCYNKGNQLSLESLQYASSHPSQIDFHTIPNVGRECHTYLTHIIENYNNLGDITVYVSGSCDGQYKWYKTLNTFKYAFNTKNSVFLCEFVDDDFSKISPFSITEYKSSDNNNFNANSDKSLEKSSIYPFGEWYNTLFKDIPLKYYCLRGIFAVSREHIHNRPIDFYKSLLEFVNKSPNPEAAHYIERAYSVICYPIPTECYYEIPAYIIQPYYPDGIIVSKNQALQWPFQPKESISKSN